MKILRGLGVLIAVLGIIFITSVFNERSRVYADDVTPAQELVMWQHILTFVQARMATLQAQIQLPVQGDTNIQNTPTAGAPLPDQNCISNPSLMINITYMSGIVGVGYPGAQFVYTDVCQINKNTTFSWSDDKDNSGALNGNGTLGGSINNTTGKWNSDNDDDPRVYKYNVNNILPPGGTITVTVGNQVTSVLVPNYILP